MGTNMEWMARRACDDGVDPELFFPHPNDAGTEAKAICRVCPVAASCLEYALAPATLQEHGVWGCMTEKERRAVIRRRARKNRSGQAGATISVNEPTEDERCGTYAGTRAHRRRLEWLCDPCRDARSVYEMDRRRKQFERVAS